MIKLSIVDDESLVRVGFQTIIDWQAAGYELFGVYRNGKEAWDAFCQEGYPDVLLTDIRMPEMDGLELIRQIRQTDTDMIILILSSYEEFEYTRKSIQLGVQDYIPKHLFDPEELIATLSRLTDKRKNALQDQKQQNHSNALEEEAAVNDTFENASRDHYTGCGYFTGKLPNVGRNAGKYSFSPVDGGTCLASEFVSG